MPYYCWISKREAVDLLQKVDLKGKIGTLENTKKLFSNVKMVTDILILGDIEIVLVCKEISSGE